MRKSAYHRLRRSSKVAAHLLKLSDRHGLRDVFHDFVALSAYAVSNKVDLHNYEHREAAYMQIIGKYPRENAMIFKAAFHELVAFQKDPSDGDVLGQLAGEMDILNGNMGQFFTPFQVSQLMARLTMGDCKEAADRSFITMCDPCCGAGSMVIAAAEALAHQDVDYRRRLHATAIDLDPHCVRMTFLQCAMLDIPAVITQGNCLSMEMGESWFTPAHILGGWSGRLREHWAAERNAAWWDERSMAERVAFLQQHHLAVKLALQTNPDPAILASIEARQAIAAPPNG